MSVLHSNRTTPRTSASHGRIVTQNSTLSAVLRENSDVVAVSSAPSVSVNSSALDVVSSHANIPNASTNLTSSSARSNSDVPFVAVSESRLSLNSAVISNRENSPTEESNNQESNNASTNNALDSNVESNTEPIKQEVEADAVVTNKPVESSESRQSNRYNYQSLKSKENTRIQKQVSYVKDSGTFCSGDGNVHSVSETAGTGQETGESINIDIQAESDPNNRSYVASRLKNQSRTDDYSEEQRNDSLTPALDTPQPREDSLHELLPHEPSLIAHQFTRLSLNSQYDRVSRDRVPYALDDSVKSVPPLDLNDLSRNNSSDDFSQESDSADDSQRSDFVVANQNLHASDRKTALTHFSPHDKFETGRRTYEVESPVLSNNLPHVKSSADNFRQEGAEAQGNNQDTYRDNQQGPDQLEPHRSDLADDLNVPFPFDTQAQSGNQSQRTKPPSPPIQTTPPPGKEPATSLRNSQVYAVTNPEVQRAQSGYPRKDNNFAPSRTSNTTGQRDEHEVRFNAEEQRPPTENRAESQVRDRVPTPYTRSPQRDDLPPTPPGWDSPIDSQEKQRSSSSRVSRHSLPPQHPPIDTLHTPKSGTRRLKNEDTLSIKRVYVESPSFTREEEEEYRFVNSRLDDIDDKNQPTYRDMEGSRRGYGGDDKYVDIRTQKRDSGQNRDRNDYGRRGPSDYDRRDKSENDRRDRDEYDRRDRAENDRRDRNEYDRRDRGENDRRDRGEYDRRDRGEYDRRDRAENDRRDRGENDRRDRVENDRRDRAENDRQDRDDYDRRNDRQDDRNKRDDDDKRYEDRNRIRTIDKEPLRDRYEDRTREMNGYSEHNEHEQQRGRDERDTRYDDRSKYQSGEDERYDRMRHERDEFNREIRREDEPNVRGYQKQNTEIDEQELRKEEEYQKDLKKRIEINTKNRDARYGGRGRGSFDKENDFPRDSLEYPDERGYARDSLDYNSYNDQPQDWDNPPQNPYQQEQYYQQGLMKQDSKPDFYDPEDAERMEIVNPKLPRYDYVNKNKEDYGLKTKKSYREIVHRKKEEEERLDHVFISPKVPSKAKKKAQHQKAQSAQPEHMGHQPPAQFPMGFKPSSAEEVWQKRAQMLSVKKDSAQSNKPAKGSASKGKAPRWNSTINVKQPYKYEAPPELPPAAQPYRAPNYPQPDSREQGYSQNHGGYGTPTRQLQPLENKPAAPMNTEYVPTAINPASPFRRHLELKPISQEITTEDGQRISVDINLRLISPPPGASGPPSPQYQQQLALVPVQETQPPMDQRGIGVQYQMQDMYGNYDNGNGYGYADVSIPLLLFQ